MNKEEYTEWLKDNRVESYEQDRDSSDNIWETIIYKSNYGNRYYRMEHLNGKPNTKDGINFSEPIQVERKFRTIKEVYYE